MNKDVINLIKYSASTFLNRRQGERRTMLAELSRDAKKEDGSHYCGDDAV